jgi:chromosome segregation ATPase
LIYLHEKAIDSCSWDYTFSSYSSSKIWSKEWSLTDEAKAVRRKLIAGYRAKIAEIKSAAERKAEEERKQRIKAYWDNHKQEKDALENEAKSLESQKKQYTDEIAQLQKQKESVPALAQLIQVQKNIEKLEEEKKALGLFKGKEKKAIQEKIDVQETDKNRLKQQVASQQQEIEQKITPVRTKLNAAIARLKAIDQELTKDRK